MVAVDKEELRAYIAEHGIEKALAGAVNSILATRPSDPLFEISRLIRDTSPTGKAGPRMVLLKEVFAVLDLDKSGRVDAAEYRASVKSDIMLKFFDYIDAQGRADGQLAEPEWLAGMSQLGNAMSDDQFEQEVRALLVEAKPIAHIGILKRIFAALDIDGSGSVDVGEYKASVKSEIMLKFFDYIDMQGVADGQLSLDEWLAGMGKLGAAMSDAEFEAQLTGLLVAAKPAAREAMLKRVFVTLDADSSGLVTFAEYKAGTSSEIMLKFFAYLDAQASGDGQLSMEDWLAGMGTLGAAMSDEEFERELKALLVEAKDLKKA